MPEYQIFRVELLYCPEDFNYNAHCKQNEKVLYNIGLLWGFRFNIQKQIVCEFIQFRERENEKCLRNMIF